MVKMPQRMWQRREWFAISAVAIELLRCIFVVRADLHLLSDG